jgi:hypothetical protein
MDYPIETGREPDGRWTAKMPRIPGLVVYEHSREGALAAARKLSAILRNEAMRHDRRILAFYPGSLPRRQARDYQALARSVPPLPGSVVSATLPIPGASGAIPDATGASLGW